MGLKSGYKETEIGVIPEDWDVRQLGEVSTFLDGQRKPVKAADRARMQGTFPYYGASGIVDYVNDYIYDEDLILLGEDGENILSRNLPLAFRISGKTWVNNHAHVIRPNSDISIRFLAEYLESLDYVDLNSGTAQPKLNKQKCLTISIALPSNPVEQRATALSDVDALLEGLDRLIAKKRDLKQAAMQQPLTGQTRLPGFEGEWETKRIGALADIDPENLSSTTASDYHFNYISLEQVDSGNLLGFTEVTFRTSPSRARRVLRHNDVLVATVRPNLKSHLHFRSYIQNAVCSTGFAVIRVKPKVADSGFIFSHFFAEVVNDQIDKILAGSNYPAINSSDVKSIEIPCPPTMEEQAAITTILMDMDAEIGALEKRRAKTAALKQAMMQELLTGRTRLVNSGI